MHNIFSCFQLFSSNFECSMSFSMNIRPYYPSGSFDDVVCDRSELSAVSELLLLGEISCSSYCSDYKLVNAILIFRVVRCGIMSIAPLPEPSTHSYLGNTLEDVRQRVYFEEDETLSIPIAYIERSVRSSLCLVSSWTHAQGVIRSSLPRQHCPLSH